MDTAAYEGGKAAFSAELAQSFADLLHRREKLAAVVCSLNKAQEHILIRRPSVCGALFFCVFGVKQIAHERNVRLPLRGLRLGLTAGGEEGEKKCCRCSAGSGPQMTLQNETALSRVERR